MCPPPSLERGQCVRKQKYAILDEEYPSLSLDTKLPDVQIPGFTKYGWELQPDKVSIRPICEYSEGL